MVTIHDIKSKIDGLDSYTPIRIIERNLGMPPTTLQKALNGKRELPKKWFKPLETYLDKGVRDLTKPTLQVKNLSKEPPKTNYQVEIMSNEEIREQIAQLVKELSECPKSYSEMGRIIWVKERNKKIQELKQKLK